MLTTVTIGSYISVQGMFVRELPNGRVEVRVGDRIFAGKPVSKAEAA